MRKGIATVSLSGRLPDKLAAAAAAGLDGVEIFDNDLIASELSPIEVARRCADLGLSIDLFQPVRDVEGVHPESFAEVEHRFSVKLDVMEQLGATTVLCCSNARPDAIDDLDLSAEQLNRIGELAAERGVVVAFEALAWGRHVHRIGQAWEAVRRADHPAVTVAVDTFHLLSRGDTPDALAGIPGDRIGFLQVADAPQLEMSLLEWSRHHRCFPGQGTLDVVGVVAATLEAGYRGPLSLEVFSDVVREADPFETARDARRSLIFLEDQLAVAAPRGAAGDVVRDQVTRAAPPAARVDPAFVEIATRDEEEYADASRVLGALGLTLTGRHRSKPVERWSNGDVHVVLDRSADQVGTGMRPTGLGLVAPPVAAVADRAKALLWPAVDRVRGAGEALLPGLTSPSGLHLFLSAEDGADCWRDDFVDVLPDGPDDSPEPHTGSVGWLAIDHVGVAVAEELLNQEMSFHRTLLDLVPGGVEEFIDPHGRLRSRPLRPREGALRVVLNVIDSAPHASGASGVPRSSGVTQLAIGVQDVVAQAVRLRAAGIELMPVPDNYYVDLDARFGLPADRIEELRDAGLLYDRDATGGELLHLYTRPLAAGFHLEMLERRGGYDGYGSASTHVRLAEQSG